MQGKERQLGVSLRIQIRPRSAAQFCSRAWFHSRPGSSGSGWHTQTWSWIDSGPECFLACIFYRSAGFLTTSFFFSCFPNLSTYHTSFNLTGDKQAINKKNWHEMQTVCPNREHRPPDMRCLSHCSSSSLFFFSSTGHLLNLALMKISLFYLPQQRYITADAKGVFSLRTVLDWPTFRAVVDSEIAPLFDLFLGLSAWIPVYSLHVEKRYDNQGLVEDTSATDVI